MNEYTYTILHIPTGRRFTCRVRCYGADFLSLLNAWNRAGEGKWLYYSDSGADACTIPHEILGKSQTQLALTLESPRGR